MNKKRMKIVTRAVRQLLVLMLFAVAATTLALTARGYRYNPNRRTIEATGAIVLKGDVVSAIIKLNGQAVGEKLPLTLPNLAPHSSYTVTISKENYHPWSGVFLVEPELLSHKDDIRLWPEHLTIAPLVSQTAPDTKSLCTDNAPSKEEALIINGGELRTTNRLITRISEPILSACWFHNDAHIVYITTGAMHVLESDGANDTELTTFTEKPDALAIENDGTKVYVREGGTWNTLLLNAPLPTN